MTVEYYMILEEVGQNHELKDYKLDGLVGVNLKLTDICELDVYSNVYDTLDDYGWSVHKIAGIPKYKIFITDMDSFLDKYDTGISKTFIIKQIRGHKLKTLIE
jgi:hypothetical protein